MTAIPNAMPPADDTSWGSLVDASNGSPAAESPTAAAAAVTEVVTQPIDATLPPAGDAAEPFRAPAPAADSGAPLEDSIPVLLGAAAPATTLPPSSDDDDTRSTTLQMLAMEIPSNVEDLTSTVTQMREKLAAARAKRDEYTKQLAAAKVELRKLEEVLASQQRGHAELTARVDAAEQRAKLAEDQRQALAGVLISREQELSQMRAATEQAAGESRAFASRVQEIYAQKNAVDVEVRQRNEELVAARQRIAELEAERSGMQQAATGHEDAEKRIAELEAEKAALAQRVQEASAHERRVVELEAERVGLLAQAEAAHVAEQRVNDLETQRASLMQQLDTAKASALRAIDLETQCASLSQQLEVARGLEARLADLEGEKAAILQQLQSEQVSARADADALGSAALVAEQNLAQALADVAALREQVGSGSQERQAIAQELERLRANEQEFQRVLQGIGASVTAALNR